MGSTLITRIERQEAVLLAQELLAQVQTRHTVQKLVLKAYPHMSRTMAKDVVSDAERALLVAMSETPEQTRAKFVARTEALYRKCWREGRLPVCARVLELQARIFGVEKPKEIRHSGVVTLDDDMANRTDDDLKFFLSNRCWPEEAPQQTSAATTLDDEIRGLLQ